MTQLPMTDERMIELARELPVNMPDADQVEAVRTSLLSTVEDPADSRSPRWLYLGGAVAAAAGVLFYIAMERRSHSVFAMDNQPSQQLVEPDTTATRKASVDASKGAHFTHTRAHGDEIVSLTKGALKVRVAKLSSGETFKVRARTAIVEAHASTFDVDVGETGLRSVRVHTGRVTIRVKGHAAVFLSAGETWRPKLAVVHETRHDLALPTPPPTPPIARKPEPEPTPTPTPRTIAGSGLDTKRKVDAKPVPDAEPLTKPKLDQPAKPNNSAEHAFKLAWTKLRAKNYTGAASEFEQVIRMAPTGSFAPDARYWLAVALLRAGDSDKGRAAMESFLVNHATSSRVGEVSTMLGWLHLKAGRRALAKKYFSSAADDHRTDVRTSARAGLKAVR